MIDERKQPEDLMWDEPGTQPKKYYKGLSKKDKTQSKHFVVVQNLPW